MRYLTTLKKYTLGIVLLLAFAACNRHSSCPSYWEGDKSKADLKGTPLVTDENGQVQPSGGQSTLADKSPVRKDAQTGLVKKKKNKKVTRSYAQSKKHH